MTTKKLTKLLALYLPYKTNNYYAILMRGGSANAVLEKDR